jgi:hypothetical protein
MVSAHDQGPARSVQRRRLAVLLYGASWEGMAVSFTLIFRHLLRRELLVRRFDAAESRGALRRFGDGVALFPAATLVGLLDAGRGRRFAIGR